MKNLFNILLNIAIVYMILDAIGFMLWALSGQHTADSFFLGMVTLKIIKTLIAIF